LAYILAYTRAVKQVDVEREHYAGFEPIADHFDRIAIGRHGMVPGPRIFQRCESVAR
jgi:hypothetical protein